MSTGRRVYLTTLAACTRRWLWADLSSTHPAFSCTAIRCTREPAVHCRGQVRWERTCKSRRSWHCHGGLGRRPHLALLLKARAWTRTRNSVQVPRVLRLSASGRWSLVGVHTEQLELEQTRRRTELGSLLQVGSVGHQPKFLVHSTRELVLPPSPSHGQPDWELSQSERRSLRLVPVV
jgi:hypothetical protein